MVGAASRISGPAAWQTAVVVGEGGGVGGEGHLRGRPPVHSCEALPQKLLVQAGRRLPRLAAAGAPPTPVITPTPAVDSMTNSRATGTETTSIGPFRATGSVSGSQLASAWCMTQAVTNMRLCLWSAFAAHLETLQGTHKLEHGMVRRLGFEATPWPMSASQYGQLQCTAPPLGPSCSARAQATRIFTGLSL